MCEWTSRRQADGGGGGGNGGGVHHPAERDPLGCVTSTLAHSFVPSVTRVRSCSRPRLEAAVHLNRPFAFTRVQRWSLPVTVGYAGANGKQNSRTHNS